MKSVLLLIEENLPIHIFAYLMLVSESSPSLPAPKASPSPVVADSPSQLLLGLPSKRNHHSYYLTLVPCIAIAVTALAVTALIVLIVLIRQKRRELDEPD